MTNEQALITMVSSTIVEFHNAYADQPVKKFSDKETAIRRTCAVLAEAGMAFDESCQLRKVEATPKLNFHDDAQFEADSAHMHQEAEPVIENGLEMDPSEAGAFETPLPATEPKQRAKSQHQPRTDKDVKIAVVGGKDAANPYREGSASHKAFALIQGQPGITRAEFEAAGGRVRTLTHGLKIGQLRTVR